MRIGIDARAYGWTGIGRYARNLIRELTTNSPHHEFVLFVPARYARAVAEYPRTRVIPVRDSYYSLYEQTGFLAQLLATRVDLVHFVSFNAPMLYRRPSVVTIHDLTRFHFPGAKHRDRLHQRAYRAVFRSAVSHARRIIAVSQFTKSELVRMFPFARAKVSVVHEGVEERFFRQGDDRAVEQADAAVLRRLGIGKPYLLYVGLWLKHKNLPSLLRAFRHLRQTGYTGTLVITGEGRPWDEDVRGLSTEEQVADAVRFPGHLADEDLPALYRQADVFLFPSLSEGFGLPPLEAMASGTPVVAARAGSLPEILGDAALLADPFDPVQMAGAVRVLGEDARLRAQLIERGSSLAHRYSWLACARETLAVYARAFDGSGTLPRIGDAEARETFLRHHSASASARRKTE